MATTSSGLLERAERRVAEFSNECPIERAVGGAVERLDCEVALQLGIDAFHWLVRADETYRAALFSARAPENAAFEGCIERLFVRWLTACAIANQWIAALHSQGCGPDNLQAFRECERQVRGIAKHLAGDELTAAMKQRCAAAVSEHQNGQTAAFL